MSRRGVPEGDNAYRRKVVGEANVRVGGKTHAVQETDLDLVFNVRDDRGGNPVRDGYPRNDYCRAALLVDCVEDWRVLGVGRLCASSAAYVIAV